MGALRDYLDAHFTVRDPEYRPSTEIDDAEKESLKDRIGGVENYEIPTLRRMVAQHPENAEFRKALVSGIVSAEYAGIDAFGTRVGLWEDYDLPADLLMTMIRQEWDEVRHAQLGTQLLESYGGEFGEYPDTLGGANREQDAEGRPVRGPIATDPTVSLSVVNVQIEGGALELFAGVSKLGAKIDDDLMEFVYDYNWADEVVHVQIGDYFVNKIVEETPEEERKALMAQAQVELFTSAQRQISPAAEVMAFMQEEAERARTVLADE
jgi:hypothetical protein